MEEFKKGYMAAVDNYERALLSKSVKMSTVRTPHIYMRAVGTNFVKDIADELRKDCEKYARKDG